MDREFIASELVKTARELLASKEILKLAREVMSDYQSDLSGVRRELDKEAKRVLRAIEKNGGKAVMGRLQAEESEYAPDHKYPESKARRVSYARVITTVPTSEAKPSQIVIEAYAREQFAYGASLLDGPYWMAKVNNKQVDRWLPSKGSMSKSKKQIDDIVKAIPEAIRKFPDKFGVEV